MNVAKQKWIKPFLMGTLLTLACQASAGVIFKQCAYFNQADLWRFIRLDLAYDSPSMDPQFAQFTFSNVTCEGSDCRVQMEANQALAGENKQDIVLIAPDEITAHFEAGHGIAFWSSQSDQVCQVN